MNNSEKRVGRIKSAVLDWLGIPIGLSDDSFWGAWSDSSTAAGQAVSEKSVMSLSAAWACTRLISEAVSTLPLNLYERTSEGRVAAVGHPLYSILRIKPNADTTSNTYWESKVAAVLLRGNGFSEKQMLGGRLVGLKFLAPDRLSHARKANGTLQMMYKMDSGRLRPVPESSIFHIPGFSLDGKWGLSTIKYGAAVFGSALAATEAANGTFERGLLPTTALTIDRVVKKDQRDEFRKSVKEISGAINAGETALLEGGMGAKQIGISPADAQLLESRGYSVEEVCRWFGVDPSMVGHGDKNSNWGTGLEQKLIGFLVFTLRPWLTRIENAINTSLLSPSDQLRYYAEFSIEGLLRADSKARAGFYSVLVNNGIITRDEVRIMENLPIKGGNAGVLTVQSAMVPLDSLGSQDDGDTARAALAAWLDKGDKDNIEETA